MNEWMNEWMNALFNVDIRFAWELSVQTIHFFFLGNDYVLHLSIIGVCKKILIRDLAKLISTQLPMRELSNS